MTGETTTVAAAEAEVIAAGVVATKPSIIWRTCGFLKHCLDRTREWVPFSVYLIALYAILATSGIDLRKVFFTYSAFEVCGLHILFPLTATVMMIEFLRVSHPGVDNSTQCNLMFWVVVVSIVAFALGAVGIKIFALFARSEFAGLLIVAAIQSQIANKLNSRTAMRGMTLDNH